MATIISHAVVPAAISFGLGRKCISPKLMIAGAAASMLPDADVLLFWFGARYDSVWAHRGFSHSIGFALLLGVIAALLLRRTARPALVFTFIAFASLSHGLIDMLTNGGHGIAIFWPVTSDRYFFHWRPIQVSPLSPSRFVVRAARIAQSEFLWIWVPAIVVASGLRALRAEEERTHENP